MLYFTYKRNSNGRSGHIFGEILTVFILHCFYIKNSKIIYDNSWNNQHIFKTENLLNYCITNKNINLDKTIKITKFKKSWNGISYNDLHNLITQINNIDYHNKNILIELHNVIKIHPHQLLHWYHSKYIKTNIYYKTFLPLIRNIYFNNIINSINTLNNTTTNNTTTNTINQFAIHIRRGDLAKSMIESGLDYNYYKNIITSISNIIYEYKLNLKIVVYCENEQYEDLLPLTEIFNDKSSLTSISSLKNNYLELKLGGPNDLQTDFNELVRSKYLLISPCSMCIIAGYLNQNSVFFDKCILECIRPNLINNGIEHCFINYNSSNIEKKLLNIINK